MQTNDPTGHVVMEDLSDRSENSHSEFKVNGFQDYDRIKELNLSLEKIKDEPIIESKDFNFPLETCRQQSMMFDGFPGERNRDHSVSLEKSKDFTLPITKSKDPPNYPMDRSSDADSFLESLCKAKDSTAAGILFNFTRDGRQKSFQTSLDRTKGPGITTDREIKGLGMLKNNLSIDRINEFNMYLDRMRDSHIGNIALDRIPPNALLDAPSVLESNYFRNFQIQPRSPDLETITLEGMRRSHLAKTERSPQNLVTQLPPSIITHMQHSQQQQQQQQPKSFTIDYILGHKNNPREKHQRGQQQQFRKHQGLESSAKNGSSSTSLTGPGGGGGGGDNRSNGGGKSKRVRTIFTAEQLEKLEDLENLQANKLRKSKYMASHLPSWSARSPTNGGGAADAYWKHTQRKPHITHPHGERKYDYNVVDPIASYTTTNSYKPYKQYKRIQTSTLPPKYTQQISDQAYRDETGIKSTRNKLLANNIAIARKNRYKTNLNDGDDLKYDDDDLEISADDNPEDDVVAQGDDDREDNYVYNEKDYEEQEADDEVDEESDTLPEMHRRMRCRVHAELQHRAQQEARRLQQQQCIHKLQQKEMQPRCRRTNMHETSYGDVADLASEEDVTTPPTPPTPPLSPRKSSRRPSLLQQTTQPRAQPSEYTNRYKVIRPTSPQAQQNRRSHTTRADLESLREAELINCHIKKCYVCGESANPAVTKIAMPSGRKTDCRLQDNRGFTVKGPVGNDGEARELNICGHCATRYNMTDLRLPYEASRSPLPLYSMKPRRSRNIRSPRYETQIDDGQIVDQNTLGYAPGSSRHSRERGTVLRERTRHSLQTARDPSRTHYNH